MPGWNAERYRQNPPAIGSALKYFNQEDTNAIIDLFRHVGRNHFTYQEISQILPNYMTLRRMKTDGIIEMVRRRHNYVPSTWKFKPELAYRIEKAIGEPDEVSN